MPLVHVNEILKHATENKYGVAAIVMMIVSDLLDKFIMMNVFLIILSMVLTRHL